MGDAAVDKFGIRIAVMMLWVSLPVFAQELPPDEIQVNLSGYFDTFNVQIGYPSVTVTKKVTESTSVTGRYLVDVISAASMRSTFKVDGVTSATNKTSGGGDNTPDELRHELNAGITQILGDATLSLNGIYSTEHDYTSSTVAGHISYPLAKKNTTLQAGVVRSWDTVSPQIRTWQKNKDVLHLSSSISQILSPRLISQLNFSYIQYNGFLSDPYQVVQILATDNRGNPVVRTYESVVPDSRRRQAIGTRTNYLLSDISALEAGYRYYWDDWDVNSHTISLAYNRYFHNRQVRLRWGIRSYFQSQASFFREHYTEPERYMTVDSKLNEQFSNEYQFNATFTDGFRLPLLNIPLATEHQSFHFKLNVYHRHTATPDWHSRMLNMYALIINVGIRFEI